MLPGVPPELGTNKHVAPMPVRGLGPLPILLNPIAFGEAEGTASMIVPPDPTVMSKSGVAPLMLFNPQLDINAVAVGEVIVSVPSPVGPCILMTVPADAVEVIGQLLFSAATPVPVRPKRLM